MRNLIKIAIPSIFVFFLSACQSDIETCVSNKSTSIVPNRIEADAAIKRANSILEQLNPGTRSSEKKVASIETIGATNTRGTEDDGAYYLVNYENEEGFILTGAYDNMLPLYAFSDQGKLNIEDTTYNKGLASFFNSLPTSSQIMRIGADPNPQPGPDSVVEYEVKTIREPLLSQRMQDLDQRKAPTVTVAGCPACCVAVTMIQLMSYFKWPTSYAGTTLDWEGMNNGTNDSQINWLIDKVSNSDNLKVKFTKEGSVTYIPGPDAASTPTDYLTKTASNFKYTVPGYQISATSIISAMSSQDYGRRPLITRLRIDNDQNYYYHVFSIDGYINIVKKSYQSNYPEDEWTVSNNTYLHIVWGYGKNGNGYFYKSPNNSINSEAWQWDTNIRDTDINVSGKGMTYLNGLIPNK